MRGSLHDSVRSGIDLAHTIQLGSGFISIEVGTSMKAYKLRQPGLTNRGRPHTPWRHGTVYVPAPQAQTELPDVRDSDPACAIFTIILTITLTITLS